MAFGSYPREMMEIFWGWWGDFGGLRKEQDYLMQIRRDPTNPGIQLTLANLYFERKLYQQALEWYGRGAETAAKAAQRGMKVDKILIRYYWKNKRHKQPA